MKKYLLLLTIGMFILVPTIVQAAPTKNPNFPTFDKVTEMISLAVDSFSSSLEERFIGVDEDIEDVESRIDSLETTQSTLLTDLSLLEDRVLELENNQPTTPEFLDFKFFDNVDILLTGSQESEWFDATGFSKVMFAFKCDTSTHTSEYGATVRLLVSNDKTNTFVVHSASKAECHQGGSTTLDVAGRYYQVIVGNNTNRVTPPMTVSATGYFR